MEKLHLGIGREVITPNVGGRLFGYAPDVYSETVHDDLTATVFYFRQGDKKALMISATVCLIRTDLANEILEKIEKTVGIGKENILLSATHTHSGPCTNGSPNDGWGDIDREYCDTIFIPKILSAVQKAIENPQIVRVAKASGKSLLGINRRQLTIENTIKLAQNEWAPFDPIMTILSFQNEAKEIVANLIHYGAHCTAAGKNHEITRDWAGIMIDAVEEKFGGVAAFFNGPEGDVGPRLSNGKTTGDISYVEEIGAVAAADAVAILNTLTEYNDEVLFVNRKRVSIPLKPRMDLETAKAQLEEYKTSTVNLKGRMRLHAENVIRAYQENRPEKPFFSYHQTFVGFGRTIFASCPFELFSEIGMRINQYFDDLDILSLSNTNGSESYFVTQDVICRGGYEVNMFLFKRDQSYCDNADWELITQTVNNIDSLIS